MSTLEKLSELESHRLAIESHGGEEALKAAHSKGKLMARERITQLLDVNSFVEIGTFIKSRSTAFNMNAQDTPADGVVCGYGTINGTLVYVYSQDATVMGGAIGEMHAKKIVRLYDDAIKMGAPIIGFLDSVGIRLQETIDALDGYGTIFNKSAEANGVIPQICVIGGDCAGGASFLAGLSDFVIMASKNARMFLNSPNTLDDKEASFDKIATAKVHFEESGLAQFMCATEEEVLATVQKIITYLPSNCFEDVPCYEVKDDLNRVDLGLNNFDFTTSPIEDIVKSVADENDILEISAGYGQAALTAFGRMNGGTVGFIANNDLVADFAAIKKMTAFAVLCDKFNIPLVTFTNIEGFDSTVATEKLGIIKECSALVKAFANAAVPKVNIILNHAYGSAYVAMNSKHTGADYVYAWPTAHISTMNSASAVRIMYKEEIEKAAEPTTFITEKMQCFEELESSSYAVAARGYIDDIIEPAATRKRVIAALEVLYTKQI